MDEMLEFMSDKAKLLFLINERSSEIDGKRVCCLSQQEIASDMHCGKLRVNTYFKELIKSGFIETVNHRGKYAITEKGTDLLCRFLDDAI